MNRYESYITEYLAANKEVSLEKIGILMIPGGQPDPDITATSISFTCNKKASTSSGLINFITERSGKLRSLVESDLESYFSQVREFLNIGKTYEVVNAGFIKANGRGEYEFTAFPQTGKTQRTHSQPATTSRRSNSRSGIQIFTLLIVIAIVGGLCWEVYQFYIKPKTQRPAQNIETPTLPATDTAATKIDSTTASVITYNPDDSVNIRYIFETTDLLLRAKTRTAQLRSFGNMAGYDSVVNEKGQQYLLFIDKKTRIADTLAVKDSLQKFLQKTIQIQISPKP